MQEKIVITGIGAITPLGGSCNAILEKLCKGISGIKHIPDQTFSEMPIRHAGLVNHQNFIKDKFQFKWSNITYKPLKFATYAFAQALKNQNLSNYYSKNRMGIYIGTDPPILNSTNRLFNLTKFLTKEGTLSFNDHKKLHLKDKNIIETGIFPHLILSNLSNSFGFSGISSLHLGTCAASSQALGEAMLLLKNRKVDVMIAGGTSSKIDLVPIAFLKQTGVLASTDGNPKKLSRPFDKTRAGLTMGEGAVLFLLEREQDAISRGAHLIAYLSGYGNALDGASITDPDPECLGMKLAMRRALDFAQLRPENIDYLNAHGTSTVKNDLYETLAIKKVFKEYAYMLDISSTKSMHGHMMSATGAMEALVSILAINNDIIPPTINLNHPDENCDLNYTPNISKKKQIRHALSNSFGLGGQNCSLIFSKPGAI